MSDKYVQFSDESQSFITSVFGCPQDPVAHPHQGIVQDDDPRYIQFIDPGSTLEGARKNALKIMDYEYKNAIHSDISYTNVKKKTAIYQANENSMRNLQIIYLGYVTNIESFPSDFFWVAENNVQISFVYDDIKNLYNLLMLRGISSFKNLQDKKILIRKATSIKEINEVKW